MYIKLESIQSKLFANKQNIDFSLGTVLAVRSASLGKEWGSLQWILARLYREKRGKM